MERGWKPSVSAITAEGQHRYIKIRVPTYATFVPHEGQTSGKLSFLLLYTLIFVLIGQSTIYAACNGQSSTTND